MLVATPLLIAMIQKVNVPVKVLLKSDPDPKKTLPVRISWANRIYDVKRVTFHHEKYEGRHLYHEFFVETNEIVMRLKFNSSTLSWVLMEVTDYESD
jgi:hypothetical protein